MYPISNAVKALFEAEATQVLRITGTDANGTAISITDANVMIDEIEDSSQRMRLFWHVQNCLVHKERSTT